MEGGLLELRPLFSLNEGGLRYQQLFDEYLDHNELGLALEMLCEFLIDPKTPGIGLLQAERIERLARSMELQDRYCAAIREKSGDGSLVLA